MRFKTEHYEPGGREFDKFAGSKFEQRSVATLAPSGGDYELATHRMDSPGSRSVQSPDLGKVVQLPEVGGLHHHYERLAA